MSFDVLPDELAAHASHVRALTDRLAVAVDAANTASVSGDAYGLLCAFLPPILHPVQQAGIDALTASAEGVTVTADNVQSASAEYAAMDQAISQPFRATERSFDATERSYVAAERAVRA